MMIMADIDTFSIRVESSTIADFRKQAKNEHITQGKLFKKVFNLYLGRTISGEEQIPFCIHLFRFNNLKNEYLKKKIYVGYGVPLYFSLVFRFHGHLFQSDKKKLGEDTINRANDMSYRQNYSSELAFIPSLTLSFPWKSSSSLDSQAKDEIDKDFGINLDYFCFMSAFRVFKEWTDAYSSSILVNEQMYLVDWQIHSFAMQACMGKEVLNTDTHNMHNPYAGSFDLNEPTIAEDLPFAISILYKIDDISKGEEILRLNRKYLNPNDVSNLKNVLKPTISKNDSDLETILAEYSFKRG